MIDRPAWWAAALCRGAGAPARDGDPAPSNPWFSHDAGDQAAAAAICRRCPVRLECGASAIDHRETAGIWAGLTAQEILARTTRDHIQRQAVSSQ